jgi:hypothetical protein
MRASAPSARLAKHDLLAVLSDDELFADYEATHGPDTRPTRQDDRLFRRGLARYHRRGPSKLAVARSRGRREGRAGRRARLRRRTASRGPSRAGPGDPDPPGPSAGLRHVAHAIAAFLKELAR